MTARLGALLVALPVALITACASQPDTPAQTADWERHAAQLAALEDWQATGKLALRSAEQSETAGFDWQQRGSRTELDLSGPVGLHATRLSSDGSSLILERDGDRKVYDISSPGAIQRSTGWDLPLAALPYWLRGLPQPNQDSTEQIISAGRLQRLSQSGWEVQYQDYGQFGNAVLPTRLTLTRADTRLRLVIRKWQLP